MFIKIMCLILFVLCMPLMFSCKSDDSDQCQVTFDYQEMGKTEVIFVEKGTSINLPSPTFGGHQFFGWIYEGQLDDKTYSGKVVIEEDTTFLAVWMFIPGVVEPPFCCEVIIDN